MEINETFLENVHNYFNVKSCADVLKIGKEIEGQKIYVKVKIRLDYYIADENFKVVDINFEKNTINGFLDLEKTAKFFL